MTNYHRTRQKSSPVVIGSFTFARTITFTPDGWMGTIKSQLEQFNAIGQRGASRSPSTDPEIPLRTVVTISTMRFSDKANHTCEVTISGFSAGA